MPQEGCPRVPRSVVKWAKSGQICPKFKSEGARMFQYTSKPLNLGMSRLEKYFECKNITRKKNVQRYAIFGLFLSRSYVRYKKTLKLPLRTKIFDVNIVFLLLGTLEGMKNAMKLSGAGGTIGAILAHGLYPLTKFILTIYPLSQL